MFNVSKTVCMKFDSCKNNVCDFDIHLKSRQLAWVEIFDYLGFRLTNNNKWNYHEEIEKRLRDLRINLFITINGKIICNFDP